MSEVTELTKEQLLDELDIKEPMHPRDRQLRAELLHRLSPQGAGPTCPECDRTNLILWPEGHPQQVSCADCHRTFACEAMADFAQFFRAPSNPSRQEIQQAKNELLERFAAIFERVGMLEMAAVIRAEIVDEHGSEVKR